MKLRIKADSIRLRIDQRDLQELHERGRVGHALRFGPDQVFAYALEAGPVLRGRPLATFEGNQLTIQLAPEDIAEWSTTERVGFEHEQPTPSGSIRILMEKDFACLDRPVSQREDDAFAFPNPSAGCQQET